MKRKPRIFISYKTGLEDGLSFTATTIRSELVRRGWDKDDDIFMDTVSLEAGREWNRQIYENITRSDILLLLVADKTIESNWVRREVDVAKGARVTIIPVLIREKFDVKSALETFDITYVQYVKILRGEDSEYDALARAIEKNRDETRAAQQEWLRQLKEGEKKRVAEPNPRLVSYSFTPDRTTGTGSAKSLQTCTVHLAAGDMFEHSGIEVYVNTENDYMQMARIFDAKTVSALTRYYGAHLDEAERLVEDTVQDELDRLIAESEFKNRPLGLGTVIATSAGLGNPISQLRLRNRIRYLFHAATVSVIGEGIDRELECTLTESGIKRLVRKTLEKVTDVNKRRGCISPEGTPQRREQEEAKASYAPIRSIIIPIFGAGNGGRPSSEIIPSLVKGVKEHLIDQGHRTTFTLEDIYLAAYFEEDVQHLREALEKHFGLAAPDLK